MKKKKKKELVPVRDYAERVGISKSSVYAKIRSGKIKATVENNKKHVVIDNDSGEVVEVVNEVEKELSPEEVEVQVLRERVAELEEHTKLFDIILKENMELRTKLNKVQTIPLKKSKKSKKSRVSKIVELNEYLVGMGFGKEDRKVIKKRFEKSRGEDRVIEKDDKFYLNLKKYLYDELIYG
jgi:hypothetical protein